MKIKKKNIYIYYLFVFFLGGGGGEGSGWGGGGGCQDGCERRIKVFVKIQKENICIYFIIFFFFFFGGGGGGGGRVGGRGSRVEGVRVDVNREVKFL